MGSIPIGSTPIFSSEPPVSLTEKSSFSSIHQSQNLPLRLCQDILFAPVYTDHG